MNEQSSEYNDIHNMMAHIPKYKLLQKFNLFF